MSLDKIETLLINHLNELEVKGIVKGNEKVVTGIKPAQDGYSERFTLEGFGERAFLRMNSNSYLGLGLHPHVIEAEARAAEQFGTGPGAVRFISGTYQVHKELEQKLAAFHGREAAMIMSAAYATVMGVLPQFITEETLVISDALNHNCIINAIRLARPANKAVYDHLDVKGLENILVTNKGKVKRVCVVTDGIFSMRGDHAPLNDIIACCKQHEGDYEEGIISIVDDSHGVGAFGSTGRGTEEYCNTQADILIATLGKALGINGGYIVSNNKVVAYLRETAPFYIYSNPITPAEAAASIKALEIIDSTEGLKLLECMRNLAARLRKGLIDLGFEIIEGDHPIVPMLIRDTDKTSALVQHLFDNNILVTGLNYPVVPKGEEEIRLQVSASHTEKDIDYLLSLLKGQIH
jgi:glycine C-acetyltransferase